MTEQAAKPEQEQETAIDEKVVKVAKETMVGDMRDVCLQIMKDPKLTGKAWKDMKEAEQKNVVSIITDRVTDAVVRSVQIMAANGQRQVVANLEQVVVKDGVKAVLKFGAHEPLLHSVIDAQGDAVSIVLTGAEEYLGAGEKVKIDKDQKELEVEEQKEEPPHDAETGEIQEEQKPSEDGEKVNTGEVAEPATEVDSLEREAAELT